MSCCGKARAQFAGQSTGTSRSGPPPRPQTSAPPPKVVFQYSGSTAMVAIGPVSGTRYRFDGPGARVTVDPRDRRFLANVPKLSQI
jgi:hypothetical protein